MARRRVGALDALLEQWARWCDAPSGSSVLGGSGESMLARLIATKGDLMFGGGCCSTEPQDSIETSIEMAVVELGSANQMAADVLRLECVAGWWQVTRRRAIRGYDPRGVDQLANALALGISVRTYRRRLAEARRFVATRLKVKV
jgi:hypothetical protein